MPLLRAFTRFPHEGDAIGQIALAYSELEFDLCMCVGMGMDSLDIAVKALFRTRGESQRIEIADALGRPTYEAIGLGTPFAEAIGAMKYCLKIRNQYAHCNWHDDNTGRLSFLNLEEIATENATINNLEALTFFYLDMAILNSQAIYFGCVSNNFVWLNYEGRKRAGKLPTHALQATSLSQRPLLHM